MVHYSQSTYNAFDGNPVFWADPSGADSQTIYDFDGNGYSIGDDDLMTVWKAGNINDSSTIEDVLARYFPSTNSEGNYNGSIGGVKKNKGANSRGVGHNYTQMGLLGMSGLTFFGAPIRLIPYDFGASSYFGGALNVYVGTWAEYLEKGLDSYVGRHLMHEFGHFLQEKYGGIINYYTKVVPASLESFQGTFHDGNWTEIQASTLAWVYFNEPKNFNRENVVKYTSISTYAPNPIPSEIIELLQNQYINHPDYKP